MTVIADVRPEPKREKQTDKIDAACASVLATRRTVYALTADREMDEKFIEILVALYRVERNLYRA